MTSARGTGPRSMRTDRLAIVTSSGGTSSARITKNVDGGGSSTYLRRIAPNWSMRWKSSRTSTLRSPSAGDSAACFTIGLGGGSVDAALGGGGLDDVEVGVRLGQREALVALGVLALAARPRGAAPRRPWRRRASRSPTARRAGTSGPGGRPRPSAARSRAADRRRPPTRRCRSRSPRLSLRPRRGVAGLRRSHCEGALPTPSEHVRSGNRMLTICQMASATSSSRPVPSMIAQRSGSSIAWRRKPSCTRRWKASPADSSRSLARASAMLGGVGAHLEQHDEVGPPALRRPARQLLHLGGRQLAAVALVGDRRAGEAIADHRASGVEGGLDHLGDVLGAVGGHEQRLGAVGDVEVGRVEHEATHLGAERRVAGLEGEQRLARRGAPPAGGPASTCRSPRRPRRR